MVAQFLSEIEPSISPARLLRYQSVTGVPLDTVVNYFWNIELCGAFYHSLNAVEISLRNGLHRSLTQHFGIPQWYDRRGILEPAQSNEIISVKSRIRDRGNPVTPDRVVSELTFGFWVTILSRNYGVRLWSSNNAAPLKNTFMGLPKSLRQRQIIHSRYNSIRKLRNRVMHHEPIFDDPILHQRHGEIYQALHWLNPRMVDVLKWCDRFDDVYRNGRTGVEQNLKVRLGLS